MGLDVSADIEACLERDGLHPRGSAKRLVEHASSLISSENVVRLLLLGTLSTVRHGIPIPRETHAVLLLIKDGVLMYGETRHEVDEHLVEWPLLTKFDARRMTVTGVRISLADYAFDYDFIEPYRGPVSVRRIEEIEKVKEAYFY